MAPGPDTGICGARTLAWLGVGLALWQAVSGIGSLGLLLMLGLGAALALWLFGLVLKVDSVRHSAGAWILPLLLVFVVRNFGWEPYRIPSGSMIPTLLEGDFVLINRHAYGLNLQPMGWQPLILDDPRRGDVVVFHRPDTGQILIKRIIGLPGDRIELIGSSLRVNGRSVGGPPLRSADGYTRFQESQVDSQGERSYLVQNRDGANLQHKDGVWQVEEGFYFVLGDNRDDSLDSRYWGTFRRSHLLGRAEMVWLHWPAGQWPAFRSHSLIPDA